MQLLRLPHLLILLLAVCITAMPLSMAVAKDGGSEHARYTVKKGDTLIDLAEDYFRKRADYRIVQRLNNIDNPRRIPIGTELRIPYRVLRYSKESAKVAAFRGTTRISLDGKGARAPVLKENISEGTGIATGAASSLSLAVSDGSIVTIPSNSVMKIVRLRRFALNDDIDFEYELEAGAVRTDVAPLRGRNSRYRVRTPSAVSAVRGTDFRTRYDPETGRTYVELIEGGLDVRGNEGGEAQLENGFGAIVNSGDVTTEALLPAPHIVEGSGRQRDKALRFAVDPVPGATGYRLMIARDSSFIDVIEDRTGAETSFTIDTLEDGRYFAKMSALADNSLEGLPSQIAFERRLNDLSASAAKTEKGYEFRWLAAGAGERVYRLQIFRGQDTSVAPMVDEAGLKETRIQLSDLPPGEYSWRLGSTIFRDGETEERWTDFETIRVDAE